MDQDQAAEALRVVTYVTAAKYDADSEQDRILREDRHEYLEAYRDGGPAQNLIDWIKGVMGPDWKPSGEYGAFLDKLETT